MKDFLSSRWAIRDSWAEFPDQAGKVKRYIAVALDGSVADTVAMVGAFHPAATEHQVRAVAVAQRMVSLHNAALG